MIRFSRKDFPVPALPVKKTLRPLITACRTAFCSLFSVTGRAKILEGLVPCTDFCRLAARAADDALRLAGWFSCPSPGAHLRLVPPANTWWVRQKASGYLHQLLYGLWRREVWIYTSYCMDFGGERCEQRKCSAPPANTWCVRSKASSYLHQLMYGLWRREARNCSKGSIEEISKMGWSTYWLFWVHRCHIKLNWMDFGSHI